MKPFFLVSLVIAASACSGKQVPDQPPAPELKIELTENGLRPEPASPVTRESLEATFPGYAVAGEERLAIRDRGNTVVVVDVTADGGYRAKVVDESVVGPRGITVGDDWSAIGAMNEVQCRRGPASWADQVYCTSADVSAIAFVFEVPVSETPGCEADCVMESHDILASYEIDSIEWQP